MLLCFPLLGVSFFEEAHANADTSSPLLYCKRKGVEAQGRDSNQGFVVLEGSTAVGFPKETPTIPTIIRTLRRQLRDLGVVQEGELGTLTFYFRTTFSPHRLPQRRAYLVLPAPGWRSGRMVPEEHCERSGGTKEGAARAAILLRGGLKGGVAVPVMPESDVEAAALKWLQDGGWEIAYGPDMSPDSDHPERSAWDQVVLVGRFRAAVRRLNPYLPETVLEVAIQRMLHIDVPGLLVANRTFHRLLLDGIPVEDVGLDGLVITRTVRLVDFDDVTNNDWLAMNQMRLISQESNRVPDLIIFLNGLPLVVVEFKNPTDENATMEGAFNQLQTYKTEWPALFHYNEGLAVADGLTARLGSLSADYEWFLPWRTTEGKVADGLSQLEAFIRGFLNRESMLRYIHGYVAFEDDGHTVQKKQANYHQFDAGEAALASTLAAASEGGDRRGGVIWHTQGSGKSLTMAFYAGRVITHPALESPTVVVITDRNDLDDQLFGVFALCSDLLRQEPVQAQDRADLRDQLNRTSGGVVFTTIQKFAPDGDVAPLLNERRNIIVIADEAHRSQYDFKDGLAKSLRDALPNATFVGFTGTPIDLADRSTRAVFGEYVSIYDIQQAVEDHATVPIYYEARMAKLDIVETERPALDDDFEEITEGEEEVGKARLKAKWAALEALVGADHRIAQVAADIVRHYVARNEVLPGKAMIVAMSRRIAVSLYDAIVKLRPEWASDSDGAGAIKVVMTGSAMDRPELQKHVRNKAGRKAIERRFKDPQDPLKLVIVRDMWQTGFDVPCLMTMYLDKPMKDHTLMQAIARVNRVFGEKPGGLIVDYLGLGNELRKALAAYVENNGRGRPAVDQHAAVHVLKEKMDIVRGLLFGLDYTPYFTGDSTVRLTVLAMSEDHVLGLEDGSKRYLDAMAALTRAFALAVPLPEALAARDEVLFFEALRGHISKVIHGTRRPMGALEQALQQLISKAVASEGVEDIFTVAGLEHPDISILSDAFLEQVRSLRYRNVAVELLHRLLRDQIRYVRRTNVVQARSFQELLDRAVQAYKNRSIEAVQVLQMLIDLAKTMNAAQARGKSLGMNEAELAFYDALGVSDAAVEVMGDDVLRKIALELVDAVRANTTVDWNVRESARAKLRTMVRRVLRRNSYPPDKREAAVQTVLEQAEAFSDTLA